MRNFVFKNFLFSSFSVQGARERKLQMKKIREDEEEERRKVIDIEEEKIAAERRRAQIEKAKQQQYYETDRVRTFHVRNKSNRFNSKKT